MPVSGSGDSCLWPGKKAPPTSSAANAAAKICDDPYAVSDSANGWPEGPVTILIFARVFVATRLVKATENLAARRSQLRRVLLSADE